MAADTRPTLFVNATILDGTKDMQPQRNMAVAVENGKISRIEPARNLIFLHGLFPPHPLASILSPRPAAGA